MSRQDRFVRLKYDKLEAEHPAVWFHATALATYSRLLAACDKAWPSLPEMPRAVRRADVLLLRAEGLLIDCDHRRYTLRGYAKDRGEREGRAKRAAGVRWNADAHPDAHAGGHADAHADAHAPAMLTPVPVPVPEKKTSPPPPSPTEERGQRANGTNPRQRGSQPRANGTNPRAEGRSPRQERAAEKRGGVELLGSLLRRVAATEEPAR
jgi:hypothetical protein